MNRSTAVLLCLMASQPIHAQEEPRTVVSHVSPVIVNRVATRFASVFKESGMSGISRDIQACYDATNFSQTNSNQNAVLSCLLYDYSAILKDEAWRTVLAGRGAVGVGPTTTFLSREAWSARMRIYASIPFGRDTQAFGPYFGNAPNEVISRSNKIDARD